MRLLVPAFFAGADGAGAAAGSGAAVSSSALTRSEARCVDGETNAAAPESARATMSFCIFLDLCVRREWLAALRYAWRPARARMPKC